MTPRRLLLPLLLAGVTLSTRNAIAHGFNPGVLAISELPPGSPATHRFRLTQPVDSEGPEVQVRVHFPAGCQVDEGARTLACAPGALAAPMALVGLTNPAGGARVIVSLHTLDGHSQDRLITGEEPFVLDTRRSGGSRENAGATNWLWLGATHLLGGPDHLAFLLGLLSLTRGRRRLFLAVTAFSLGHAISLGLAASETLAISTGPTETLIAVSVALVAAEALRERAKETLTRRAPALVALVFGLVHGLGFASVLGERGLAGSALLRALLAFHLGIEAVQLALVVVVASAWQWARTRARPTALAVRRGSLYVAGSLGAAWTLDRVAQMLGW